MKPQSNVIKFDFHIHTTRSDGKCDPEVVVKRAKECGLNMIAITDHNNCVCGLDPKEVYEKHGIRLVYGFELSFLRGHILVLGIDPTISESMLKEWNLSAKCIKARVSKDKIKVILRWCIENNGLLIAAHPCIPSGFMSLKTKFLVELYQEGLIHGVESHNDVVDMRAPKRIYNLWHKRVKRIINEYNIPAYSNSDAHKIERLGNVYNIIELENPDTIIDVLKAGKIEIKHGRRKD